jgi:integrase
LPLTDTQIRNAKPGASIKKLSDRGGLQCWITPAGGKIWKMAYRYNAQQKTLTMGPYPAISLADARKRQDEAKALLVSGIDPSQQKSVDKLTKAITSAQTYEAIANEVVDKKRREGKASSTIAKLVWLHSVAARDLGKRPVAAITAPEVLAVLKTIEAKGNVESARALKSRIGEVFRYAIATGRATIDPTAALKGALATPITKNHAAILDPVQFGGFLRAVDSYKGQPATLFALKLMALVFARTNELRHARWSEFDMAKAIWIIPATRAKMRREHRVPLAAQAVTLLKDLRGITGTGDLLFPGLGMSGGEGRKVARKPISENTILGAIRRLGYGPEEMTGHGFRGTASTILNETRYFSADAIEKALSHEDRNTTRRTYNRGDYWEERVRMAQWWADAIDAMREGRPLPGKEPA